MKLRFLILLTVLVAACLRSPARADRGTLRMLSNRPFDAVGAGLASACACEVRDPRNAEEIERAIALRLQRLQRDPQRQQWLRTEQRLRRMGRLKPNQRLRFDRTFVVTNNNKLLIPWPAAARRQAVNTMSFSFVSFAASEEAQLRTFLNQAMPHMVAVYGQPFASSTVTIRADPNLQSLEAGLYIVSTNEIRIPPLSNNFSADSFNLVHMIMHAFHGAAVFAFDGWEEGFAHAAAQIVQKRVDPSFDPLDDPFYVIQQHDAMNTPALGNPTFFPEGGFGGMTPWRLGMAEAAWLKVFAENPSFFAQFHAQYYAQFDPNSSAPLAGNVPALKQIALGIVPMVEGQSFTSWYRTEYALDTSVTFGTKLYVFTLPLDQSIPMLIYNYTTSVTGDETPLTARANLTYRNDESNDLFAEEGNTADIASGEGAIAPQFFNLGSPNRVFIDLNVNGLSLTIVFPWHVAGVLGDPNKFFGAVLNSDSGTIKVTPQGGAQVTADVQRGVFVFTSGITFTGPTKVNIEYAPSDGGSSIQLQRNAMVGFCELIFASRPIIATVQHTFTFGTNGLHLMCLPLTPLSGDESDALGIPRNKLLLARWRPDLPGESKYEIFPNLTEPFQPGRGYWLKVQAESTVNVQGVPAATDQPTRVRLVPGFNMIGNPYSAAIDLSTLKIEPPGGVAVDLTTAVSQGLVAPGIFRFDPGNGYVIETSSLQPFRGYWIRATSVSGVTLVFTPPTGVSSRTIRSSAVPSLPRGGGARVFNPFVPAGGRASRDNWVLRLRADAPDARDGDNGIGVTTGASDAFMSKLDIVKPPHLMQYVAVSFAKPGAPRGSRLATDFRAPFSGQKSWEFVVETDLRETDVTLTWPGMAQVPKEYRFHLTDLDAHVTRSMRNTAGYTFRLGGTARVRHFRLAADTSLCPLLAVNQLQATTIGLNTTMSFTLSRPAKVTVDLVGPSGKTIRRLLNGAPMDTGLNVAQWDGRDQQGRAMPRGLYLLQLSAADDDGNVFQCSKSVQLR